MNEYISRDDVLRKFIEGDGGDEFTEGYNIAVNEYREKIKAMQAADVQSVKWISVDEALPIYDGLVLAIDKNNTVRLCIYTEFGWLSQYGNPMIAHITHWQPLPEPPKDGEQK